MFRLCLVLLSILIANSLAAPAEDLVTDLPGLTWKPNFQQYSGYLDTERTRHLHYWYIFLFDIICVYWLHLPFYKKYAQYNTSIWNLIFIYTFHIKRNKCTSKELIKECGYSYNCADTWPDNLYNFILFSPNLVNNHPNCTF